MTEAQDGGPRRILVTGAAGMLGSQVLMAAPENIEVVGTDMREAHGVDVHGVDLTDEAQVQSALFEAVGPIHGVIHTAAYTAVDKAEEEPELAQAVNGNACGVLARAAARAGAPIDVVSTDFVFDGSMHGTPYPVDAAVNPVSVYGASKRLGEEAVLAHGRDDFYVVRTSWVFGPGGKNFPRAILNRARSGQPLKVVTDQVGRPTMTHDLAEALLDVAAMRPAGGVYHAANEGQCSWHQFAVDVLRTAGVEVEVGEQTGADLGLPAARPSWSVLDTGKLAEVRGKTLPDYVDALARHLPLDEALQQEPPADGGGGGGLRGKQY